MTQEDLTVGKTAHRLIHASTYDQALHDYRKLEPKLHEAVRKALAKEIEGGQLDNRTSTCKPSTTIVKSPT